MNKKRSNQVRLSGGLQNDVFFDEEYNKVVRKSKLGRTKEMVLQEIQFINFLHMQEVNVPRVDHNLGKEDERVITYFEYINGELIDVTNPNHWNIQLFEQWGKELGKMHSLVKKYKLSEVHRPVWSPNRVDVFGIRDQLVPTMKEIYDKHMEKLLQFQVKSDTFGLIHNDFHQGNIILVGNTPFIIDFDDCAFNWFAQDIATAFYHAYWQQNSFNQMNEQFIKTFLTRFFKGYKLENLLHNDIVKQIPVFLKLREIFLYHLFVQKWDLNRLEEWQKYTLIDLENKINNDLPYANITDFSIYQ
ncbi:phosphotransferase [Bacillus sp. UNCCL81]|uniref:phosphotransferase enzyme family protein n=1 Tax=Bacillus sp. UNCCL81 TaxID=1502755 RepID=UPI0008EF2E8A|nr:phosphotransferase [Bacillus sp. UNCCL81]SFD49468.1 Ser/Thr protein kinase RdoA involved in Cpx stress response, MazF antagonist [Bacillus sp. UNCCL81]